MHGEKDNEVKKIYFGNNKARDGKKTFVMDLLSKYFN